MGDIYTARQNSDDVAELRKALADLGSSKPRVTKVTTVASDLGYPGGHDLPSRECTYWAAVSRETWR
jgi:hypothetical protein